MGKTYKDKPEKWRRDVPRRPKGPKNGTLNHQNKPKAVWPEGDKQAGEPYDPYWNHH